MLQSIRSKDDSFFYRAPTGMDKSGKTGKAGLRQSADSMSSLKMSEIAS